MPGSIPLIALIGYPNSGKSTLMNRLTGAKKAIVSKQAHTTRDLNFGEDFWEGYYLRFVDTGGLIPDPEDKIQKQVQIKSWTAIEQADILIWLIDRKQNPEILSQDIYQRVWKTGKPLIVAINKVDDPNLDVSESEYAFLGGDEFINISCNTGYGLDLLMEAIMKQVKKAGFSPSNRLVGISSFDFKPPKARKTKTVKPLKEGGFMVIRDETGMYESNFDDLNVYEEDKGKTSNIENLIFDLSGVVFSGKSLNKEVFEFIKYFKYLKKKVYYLSNLSLDEIEGLKQFPVWKFFSGGFPGKNGELETLKPSTRAFHQFISEFKIDPEKSLFIDDSIENIKTAQSLKFKTCLYSKGLDLYQFYQEFLGAEIPKVLFLGKPNVGKSSLFNLLSKSQLQIVTDVAGTTLSVNDTLIKRNYTFKAVIEVNENLFVPGLDNQTSFEEFEISIAKSYILLDSVGIRRISQRKFEAENFATFRTIQTAKQADVICLVLDASQSLTHQDQVVAGIVSESKKGVVIIANKSDLTTPERKTSFYKEFETKFNFFKIKDFLWVSATQPIISNTEDEVTEKIFSTIDQALIQTSTKIEKTEIRKLFNYIMKQKPPKKLRNKRKPVIYDLVYASSKPPTFFLLLKDPETIHKSYLRFLENLIRKNFNFSNSEIVVKTKKIDQTLILS